MEKFLDIGTIDIISRLLIAIFCGMLIGVERVWAHKTAGMRTYALVAMGSALFVIISEAMVKTYIGSIGLNPLHIVAQIVVGVGFLGAGLIFSRDSKVINMTSATALWVSAGIGMAAGFRLYKVAIIATILTLFIFIALWFIENQLKKMKFVAKNNNEDNVQNQ